jgi:hypothetical protein
MTTSSSPVAFPIAMAVSQSAIVAVSGRLPIAASESMPRRRSMIVPGVTSSSCGAPLRRFSGTCESGHAFQWPIPSGKAWSPPCVASAGTGFPPVSSSPTIVPISSPAASDATTGA